MHKGSEDYFIGTILAKPLLLYSLGGSINVGVQLFLIYIGALGTGFTTLEEIPELLVAIINVVLPILPPISSGDILNFLLNITFGFVLAMWWTMKWSHGMSRRR